MKNQRQRNTQKTVPPAPDNHDNEVEHKPLSTKGPVPYDDYDNKVEEITLFLQVPIQ